MLLPLSRSRALTLTTLTSVTMPRFVGSPKEWLGGVVVGYPPPSKSLVGGVVGGSSHSRDKPLVDLCDCYLF